MNKWVQENDFGRGRERIDEEGLYTCEERYRLILQNVNDAIFVNTLHEDSIRSICIDVNHVASKMLGYSKEELLTMTPFDLLSDDSIRNMPTINEKLIRDKQMTYEATFRTKAGEVISTEVSSYLFELDGKDTVLSMVRDISDRKRAEKALKESEEKFRDIFNNVSDSILVQEIQPNGLPGRFIEVNDYACMEWGFSKEELLTMNPDSLGEYQKLNHAEMLMDAFRKQGRVSFETVCFTKDGQPKDVEITAYIKKLYGRQVVLSIVHNITERKRVQEEVHRNRIKYEMMFLNMLDGFAYFKIIRNGLGIPVNLSLATANNKFMEMFSLRDTCISEAYLTDMFSHLTPQELKNAIFYLSDISPSKALDSKEFYLNSLGKWYIISAYSPEADHVAVIIADITKRKQDEEALKKSQALYHSLFMNMDSDYTLNKVILDDNGKVVDFIYLEVNEAFARSLKMNKEDIVNKRFTDLFPQYKNKDSKFMALFERAAVHGEKIVIDGYFSEILGRWYSLALYSPEKNHFVSISTDIHDRKMAEESLKSAMEQARAADKAKSEFLAKMSHEIRTPINGITGMINITRMTDLTEEQRENLNVAKSCTDSLLNIVNDILDFSKIEAGKLEIVRDTFNLQEMLEPLVRAHSVQAEGKHLSFTCHLSEDIPTTLYADPVRLNQVLNNLLGNAIKFTERGSVRLSITKEWSTKGFDELLFHISDTGIGIAPHELSSLFQSFNQLDGSITRRFGGTGLGLVISKQIIEVMGGRIWVESKKGVGSHFYFSLPFKRVEEEKPFLKPEHANSNASIALNILLVEDDKVNQIVFKKLLEQKGHRIRIAQNGKEALDILKMEKYDIIFMDIQMPVMDGLEATRQIRNLRGEVKDTPIIAVTAHAIKGDKERILSAQIDDYLAKPIQLEELYAILDKYSRRIKEALIIRSLEIQENLPTAVDVELTRNEITPHIRSLKRAIDDRNMSVIENESGFIKRLAAEINDDALKRVAFKLELAARRRDMSEIIQLFPKIRERW